MSWHHPAVGPRLPREDAEAVRQRPLSPGQTWAAVACCIGSALGLLATRQIHQPRNHVGRLVRFADGTEARVYRETVADGPAPATPAVLVVGFRLRGVRGRGHALFRAESRLNTPLFVGFPGFVSKLWMSHDERGLYRGIYQWKDPQLAEDYARALWRVLALVSARGSIRYQVLPGVRRDELLDHPELDSDRLAAWCRPARPWTDLH
jgi:hypothetical protein